jgi:hypothetical protein
LGVTTGANDKAALVAAGADLTLPDLDAFVAWLPAHAAASARRPRNVTSGP